MAPVTALNSHYALNIRCYAVRVVDTLPIRSRISFTASARHSSFPRSSSMFRTAGFELRLAGQNCAPDHAKGSCHDAACQLNTNK